MSRIIQLLNRLALLSTAAFIVIAFPLPAIADEAPASGSSTSASTTAGPKAPQGPDANTYTYNSQTGMWENTYYIWNPATGQTKPKTPRTYSYNPATGHWDTTEWIYDAAQGKYVPNVISVAQPPAGAITTGGPIAPTTQSAQPTASTGGSLSTQGPESPATSGSHSTGLYDNFYNASISNTLHSSASTGNAIVTTNTSAGDASSGNAAATATLINLLMSAANPLQSGTLSTFTQNIYGNVQGDILIDPNQLSQVGSLKPDSTSTNLTVNSQASGQINNDIDLSATSGNATVSNNTSAGSAKTGSADTVANVLNVVNSIIGAGQSFMGSINIFGNLDGDILMPQNTLNNLLASGNAPVITVGPNSPVNSDNRNTLTATIATNSTINNNLNLTSAAGAATVTNNTSAGNATSGNANTNITLLNLTGKQIAGSDALLVFVNVLGSWVGMIVNAPTGSTAAALGGGITANGPNSPVTANQSSDTTLNSTTSSAINNNLKLSSLSGSALVSNNTSAGNATSGNATASVNLLNIISSSLNLNNWLGVLFINVFGSWNGSFGVDTAAGSKPAPPVKPSGGSPSSAPVKAVQVFRFIPSSGSSNSYKLVQLASATGPSPSAGAKSSFNGAALAPSVTPPQGGSPTQGPTNGGSHNSLLWTAGSLFSLAGILTTEELIHRRQQARQRFRSYLRSITVEPLKRS